MFDWPNAENKLIFLSNLNFKKIYFNNQISVEYVDEVKV